jgi:CBS domain-containing protein
MEQREIIQRVVGILTEAIEMRRQARENPDGEVEVSGAVGAMLEEMLPPIEIPADATPVEVAAVVGQELGPVIEQITSAFAFSFAQLAEVHDEGNIDVSSAEVLQSIALHFEDEVED